MNLLWCVPGQVGGSEEYVTRALAPLPRGGARRAARSLFVLPGFAAAHPEPGRPLRAGRRAARRRRRSLRVVAERTWLAAEAARRACRSCTTPGARAAAARAVRRGRADHARHPVRRLPAATSPALKLAWLRREVPGRPAPAPRWSTTPSEFVRGTWSTRSAWRPTASSGGAPRPPGRLRQRPRRRGRAARPLRPARAVPPLPGGHVPPQEPPPAARTCWPGSGPRPTSGSC